MRTELNPHVTISGTGSYLPPRLIDNDALRGLIRGYDEDQSGPFGAWVDQVTHIHERRFCAPRERSSDLGLIAAKRALDAAGVDPKDVGMVVYACFTPCQLLPGDHVILAHDVGATNAGVFRLEGACAGSIYALSVAYSMVAAGTYEHVLVVGTETISRIVNYADPLTAIIFGDGAGAAVVSRGDGSGEGGMLPPEVGFKYNARNIQLPNSNIPVEVACFPDRETQPGVPLVEQALIVMESGPTVLRSAVNEMAGCVARSLGYELCDFRKKVPELLETVAKARIVPHQANGRILDGLADKLRVAPERLIRTIYLYGNISAASNLIALDFGLRRGNQRRILDDEGHVLDVVVEPEHRIQSGELVLMPSIGGGYLMGCVGFVADKKLAALEPIEEPEAIATTT
jgi:3-oxoacyl-[acyl-carrier-protein] synthase-3